MMNDIGLIFILTGLFFNLVGAIGLVRMPDIYCRLQAATKCVTLGTGLILSGLAIYSGISQEGMKAMLCLLFIILTAPTAAHEIARGAHIYGIKQQKGAVADKYEGEIDRKEHWGRES